MARKANYGIDSPGIVAGLLAAAALAFIAARFFPHPFHLRIRWIEWLAGAYFLTGAAGFVFYSKRGKLRYRDQILEAAPWRGDELVLDAGCGRGLLLIGAAQLLRSGRAVGADIWLPGAITGNTPQSVRENAAAAGVSDRVDLAAANARQLPFQANAFDVVMSNYLIHEVNTAAERKEIVLEMARVLKPGGRLAIADFIFTRECVQVLREAGLKNAGRVRLGGAISFWLSTITSFGTARNYLIAGQKSSAGAPCESSLLQSTAQETR